MDTRRSLAIAMMVGALGTALIDRGKWEMAEMVNHYRGRPLNGSGRRTNAAAHKRAARKLRNIRARNAK